MNKHLLGGKIQYSLVYKHILWFLTQCLPGLQVWPIQTSNHCDMAKFLFFILYYFFYKFTHRSPLSDLFPKQCLAIGEHIESYTCRCLYTYPLLHTTVFAIEEVPKGPCFSGVA